MKKTLLFVCMTLWLTLYSLEDEIPNTQNSHVLNANEQTDDQDWAKFWGSFKTAMYFGQK